MQDVQWPRQAREPSLNEGQGEFNNSGLGMLYPV